MQYFDRDVLPAFDRVATPVLARFMRSADVEGALLELEAARRQTYGELKPR